jgi:hypothetical protein
MSVSLIALIRDHSGSMTRIAKYAARDYNATVHSVRAAAEATQQETFVSVLELGYGHTSEVRTVIDGQPVQALIPIAENAYTTNGGTPLWDSVGDAIDNLLRHPRANDPEAAFLVSLTTDGQEMHSRRHSARSICAKMEQLIATDKWTFIFRVPRGDVRALVRLGVHEGNILGWDQSERGVATAQAQTTQAMTDYMSGRAKGMTSTKRFFADLSEVKVGDVREALTDVRSEISFLPVSATEHDEAIRDFVERRTGDKMLKGAAFYQLTKGELKVQDYKLMAVRSKTTGEVFASKDADEIRAALGLPTHSTKMSPSDLGDWDLFIQSTSTNRKVVGGTDLLYWPGVGKRFKEGKSA